MDCATNHIVDRVLHNAAMSKKTLKQIVIPVLVLVLLASASVTVHAATEEPVHAYTTVGDPMKTGFGYGLLALGAVAVVTFLTRYVADRVRR